MGVSVVRVLPLRLLTAALCTTVAAALLAACSGTRSSPSPALPGVGNGSKVMQLGHGHPLMAASPKFLAVPWHGHMHMLTAPPKYLCAAQFSLTSGNISCYPKNNSGNGPPACSLNTGANVNGFASDKFSDLIVPNAFNGIQIYAPNCGALKYQIADSIGQAADAAAPDGTTGHSIVVGHANGVAANCNTSTCTSLTSNSTGFVQVAMDNSGNCWASAFDSSSFLASLWYWAGCTGTGVEQTGFSSPTGSTGGIDIDNAGNIVAVAQGAPSTVTVYHCASGACSVVTGPTSLNGTGDAVYCHLGKQNERLACGNASTGTVDVYSYLPTRVPAYMYSFSNGLSSSNIVETAVYTPRSPR
jgi:hypothetical protein